MIAIYFNASKKLLLIWYHLHFWAEKIFSQARKSVSWEYSYHEEYLEEFNEEKILKYSLLLAVFPQNLLDPGFLGVFSN